MLVITRKVGESLIIDGVIEIKILDTHGDKIRVGITAPREMSVMRSELVDTEVSNREAVTTASSVSLDTLLEAIKKVGDKY